MKRLFVLLTAVALAAATPAFAQTSSSASSALSSSSATPLSPGAVSTGADGSLTLAGQTEPAAEVKVPSPAQGQLSEVDVQEGQIVKKGQQLAKLDDAIQQAVVELARETANSDIAIRYQQNQLASAQNQYDKVKSNPAFTDTEKRQRELDVKQAELAVEKAKEDQKQDLLKLKQEQIRLDRMTIRSPIDGAVLRINKHAGEQTDENPLMTVVQTSKLHAVFYPPQQMFGKVGVGDKETLQIEGKPHQATVITVDPVLDQAGATFQVKMELDNADRKIIAGDAVTWVWKPK